MRRGEKGKAVVPDERLVLLWQGPVHNCDGSAREEKLAWNCSTVPTLALNPEAVWVVYWSWSMKLCYPPSFLQKVHFERGVLIG